MHKYYYKFATGWSSVDTLTKAREMVKYIIKQDRCVSSLFRDKEGRVYIKKCYLDENIKRVY